MADGDPAALDASAVAAAVATGCIQKSTVPPEGADLPATTASETWTDDLTSSPEQPQIFDNIDDGDSAFYEPSDGSETTSLASFINRHRYENGRRYHAYQDGAYWAPNDDVQNDTMDIAHHLWLLALDNKLHIAPIEDPQTILDVGTGTGIWAIDMADKYPSAKVVGVDLSATQPDWIAPNCTFEIDDVTLPWTYRPNSFDFIHIREMFGSITDWDEFYAQAFRTLKPGGWLEAAEHSVHPCSDDGTVTPDHVFNRYGEIMEGLSIKMGKQFEVWKEIKDRMIKAGFVDVVEVRGRWPMRGWGTDAKMRELGRWNQLRVSQGIEGFAVRVLTAVGGWSYTEVQAFVGQIRSALQDKSVHGYLGTQVARDPSYLEYGLMQPQKRGIRTKTAE